MKKARKCAVCFFLQGRAEFTLVKTDDELFDMLLSNYVHAKPAEAAAIRNTKARQNQI